VIADEGGRQKLEIPVQIDQTLADFRESVHVNYPVPKSEVILILVGHELVGETTTLKELGFNPGSVVHAGESPFTQVLNRFLSLCVLNSENGITYRSSLVQYI
jgi:hypothetical protein